jgi:hypothetical protein
MLVVLELTGADPRLVAEALELSAYEAGQRVRRGGWQLRRIAAAEQAAADAAGLAGRGLSVLTIPEAEALAAAEPVRVRGGRREEGSLVLRLENGERRVTGGDAVLALRGPIVREYQAPLEKRRARSAGLDPGYRFHLHLQEGPRPLELDPADFEFGAQPPLTGSSLLELGRWLEALGPGLAVDDDFRKHPPALAPSVPEEALATAALARRSSRKQQEAVVLDNLAQFRFYSGWRAAVARRASR